MQSINTVLSPVTGDSFNIIYGAIAAIALIVVVATLIIPILSKKNK